MTNTEIASASKIMFGSTEATAMYIGSTLIWYKQQQSEELPYDCRIEYLEVNGNQHINTGVVASEYPLKLKTEVYINNTSNEKAIWGNNYDQSDSYSSQVISSGQYNGKFFSWGGSTSWQLNGTCSANTWYEVEFGFPDANTKTMVIDGTNYSSNTSNGSAILNENSIYLFFNGRYTNTRMSGRMKYAKLYVGGILVRDFIPVRVGQVGYMYDKITKQLFGNLGTGSFTLGPDIVEVEYLEGTGTQHIITNLYGDNTFEFETKFNITDFASPEDHDSSTIFGARQAYNSDGVQLGTYRRGTVQYAGSLNVFGTLGSLNTDYIVSMSSNNIYVNNTLTTSIASYSTFRTPCPITLFALNQNNSITEHFRGKIYYIKLYNKSTSELIADFIPVRVGQVGYMYDKISNKLFGNSGSGTFTLGPDKQ